MMKSMIAENGVTFKELQDIKTTHKGKIYTKCKPCEAAGT